MFPSTTTSPSQRRPARHDRRARRLFRPRRDDGFAQARPGERSSGKRRSGTSSRTSSRSRCRTSGAAVAHRGHLGLRGEARAARVGAADGRAVRRGAQHGQALKLRELNAAFTDPRKISLAYLPGVAARRASRQRRTATRGCASWCASTRTGLDTDAALKAALNTDFDQLQVGFDQSVDRTFGPLRRALAGPDTNLTRR